MKRVFQAGTKRSGRMAGAFGSRASASGHRSVWTFLFLLLFMFLSLLPVPGCGSREEAASGSRSLESRGADASALPEKADRYKRAFEKCLHHLGKVQKIQRIILLCAEKNRALCLPANSLKQPPRCQIISVVNKIHYLQ